MLHVVALIHAGPDGLQGLREYEETVLPVLQRHGGRLLSAFKPEHHEDPAIPDEIHLIVFPSQASFDAYCCDPQISELAEQRASAISRTEIFVSEEHVEYCK